MVNPPTGTVTFLFTDIEGSTKRWELYPQAMQSALSRHDAILRDAIEEDGGYVFKTVGDAFCAAFPAPTDAVLAALSAQRTLRAEGWPPELGEVKVRMALHTGEVALQEGDYFGPPVNRVARILSAGHGGQTLLSEVTYGLIRDALPFGVSAKNMGEHRLKDLFRPEQIFQIVAPDLPSEFPPLRTLDNRPNNLPVQPTPLIGRGKEAGEVESLLTRPDVRLVTLTGTGGTGKTRLSLQVAAEVLDSFSNGAWFVELATLTDAQLVASTIAAALGVREAGTTTIIETLKEYLKDKQMLLVLDNFEQVIDAADIVSRLLGAGTGVKIIVTSRIPLRIRGEHEYAVPPLSLPNPRHLPALEKLAQYEAVRLFIERATAAKADFQVTNENAPAVAEICVRLDGLPLAVELAAARIKMLPPQALLTRLSQRLKVLTGGARDASARQQTLRGAIDWSYDLLDSGEKQLFARMAVFQGGRTFEALEAVCNYDSQLQLDLFDGVYSLLDKSLLQQREGSNGEPRFVMLETIHEYAREKLSESGEEGVLREQHAQHFLQFAEEAERHLTQEDQITWLNLLEDDYDNIRAALDWGATDGENSPNLPNAAFVMRLVKALWRFWALHGHFTEGRVWSERALHLERATPGDPELRAWVYYVLAIMMRFYGDFQKVNECLEGACVIFREVGNKLGLAWCLNDLGFAALNAEDLPRAQALLEESLQVKRELGDRRDICIGLINLGEAARWQGDYESALRFMTEGLSIQRELKDTYSIATTLNNFAYSLHNLGEYQQAWAYFKESLHLNQELGSSLYIVGCLAGLAGILAFTGKASRAARLFSAIEPILTSLNAVLDPSDRRDYARNLATTRAALSDEEWGIACHEGRAMSLEQAIVYAFEEPPV